MKSGHVAVAVAVHVYVYVYEREIFEGLARIRVGLRRARQWLELQATLPFATDQDVAQSA